MNIAELEEFLKLNPFDPATLVNLGKLYLDAGQISEAIATLEEAIYFYPEIFLAQNYLGDAYYMAMQPEPAIACYERASALHPDDLDVVTNLAVCHWQLANYPTAYHYSKLGFAHKPVNFALMALLMGDYENGWLHWDVTDVRHLDGVPRWQGGDSDQRRLIILDQDGGFGDSILFARFLPWVADRWPHCTLLAKPPLHRLLHLSFPNLRIVETIDENYDIQVRLPSVPRLAHIGLDSVPGEPYLRADPADCARWRDRLASHPGKKIGLRWSGSTGNTMDHLRSIGDLSVLKPLGEVPGVVYVSLEKDVVARPDIPLLDFHDDLTDFAETAALISELDLVISVDTGVLNLAGALGAPAWLMNYHGTDWRWGMQERSPWYPSIRIFRQAAFNDWASVVAQVRRALF